MRSDSYLKCINPQCGLEYPISSINVQCEHGHLLDVKYKDVPRTNLKETFYNRRNSKGSIFNESGVWRFRELLNFCQIDTEDHKQCSEHLVSLDGAEGRQSKPYRMSKAADFINISNENLWLQPEGYNPSGSFKDNGMATAVTHARIVGAKKIVCASTGNTSASAGMFAANEGIECDVYIPAGQIAPGKLSQAYQFGAQILQIDGNFDDALQQSLRSTQNNNGYTVNSINPFRIEGQKTIPFRALEYLNWQIPDWIVYPGGALGNTSSCGKALMELYQWGWIKKIPRIAVINSKGASTLSDLYNGEFRGERLRWNKGSTTLPHRERTRALEAVGRPLRRLERQRQGPVPEDRPHEPARPVPGPSLCHHRCNPPASYARLECQQAAVHAQTPVRIPRHSTDLPGSQDTATAVRWSLPRTPPLRREHPWTGPRMSERTGPNELARTARSSVAVS